MSTIRISKFNPDTDPDRPKVGDTIKGKTIREVDWMLFKDAKKDDPQEKEGLNVFARAHIERPAVMWIAWVGE